MFIVTLLLLCFATLFALNNGQVCFIGDREFPYSPESFWETSSLLQIYDWMRPQCNGFVDSVTFINHRHNGEFVSEKYFFLGVFERLPNRYGSFRLVNYARIDVDNTVDGWQTVKIPSTRGWKPPMKATTHQIFGIFYEFWDYDSYKTTVPHFGNVPNDRFDDYRTFVGLLSFPDVRQIQEFRYGIEIQVTPIPRIPAMHVKMIEGRKFLKLKKKF